MDKWNLPVSTSLVTQRKIQVKFYLVEFDKYGIYKTMLIDY